MKKRTLKKIVPFGILFFGISLLLWNCEKEDLKASIVLQELDDKYHSRTIALDDIYDVKKHLDDLMPQRDINKTSEVEGAIFDEDHVLEVIDTLQNTNYSLRFTYPDTPPGEFYNLVIGRTPEGVLKTPFVLKYTCDDNFLEDYIAHDFNMYYFKGMVKMHVYTDFFSVDAFSRTTGSCPPELDAVGDPVACEENPIGIGTGSGGPGSSSGGPGGSPGGPGGSSGGTGGLNISLTCTCVGHSVTQINDGTCTCTSYVLEIFMTNSNNRTTEDCPSCASSNPIGGIGVNEPSISSMIGNIKNVLVDLNPSELYWLHSNATNDEIMAIDLYINMNSLDGSLSNEAKEFGEFAVGFLTLNPQYTFNYLLYNRTELDNLTQTELDDYEDGGYDTVIYDVSNPQQLWPNISPVISVSDFIGWGAYNIRRNCMDYAKAQIAIKGYQISTYHAAGQTFQAYTTQNGVNSTQLSQGLSYLIYALTNGIPVIVGIDVDIYLINKGCIHINIF